MTPTRYRAAIEQLEMSITGAARFFDVTTRTSQRWASGDGDIPEAVALLLDLMLAKRLTPNKARALTDREPLTDLNRGAGRPALEPAE